MMKALFQFAVLTFFASVVLAGCTIDQMYSPEHFSKENAQLRAKEHLKAYSKEQHVPLEEFRGPYIVENKGLDYPAYTVCYTHPAHYFCYNDWAGWASAMPKKNFKIKTATSEWLEKQ